MNVRRHQRKAISPIVATVLIVAATLIAFAATAGYVFGIFGTGSSAANVQVVSASLRASSFKPANAGVTFTTGAATADYVTLTNTGTSGTSVTAVSITWAGAANAFTQGAGAFTVGAAGATGANGATTSVLFTTTSKTSVDAVTGGSYTISITLANGAILTYQSTWL
jgi:flagellin-like protein